MNRIISFFSLCFLYLLFSWPAMAEELSDQEKKEFVEQLAESFPEKKVFYRWVSKKFGEELTQAGEWTSELYYHSIRISRGNFSGSGLYVSEYIDTDLIPFSPVEAAFFSSPSQDEATLIQIEVVNPYLDFSKKKIQRQLDEKNIDIEDLKELDLQMAIRYSIGPCEKVRSEKITETELPVSCSRFIPIVFEISGFDNMKIVGNKCG